MAQLPVRGPRTLPKAQGARLRLTKSERVPRALGHPGGPSPSLALCPLVDAVLEQMVLRFVASCNQPGEGVFIGGSTGTQPLDIASALQVGLEKLLESKSRGAVAQCDVARYYAG